MKARLSTTSVTNDLTLTNHDRNWADTPQASFSAGEWQGRALRKLSGQEVTVQLRRRKAVEAPTRALNRTPQDSYT